LTDVGPEDEAHEEEGPVGIFRSWNALYASVIVYAFLLILVFYVLSIKLDYSGS